MQRQNASVRIGNACGRVLQVFQYFRVYLFIRVVLRVSCCDVMHIVEFCLRRNKVDYYIIIKEILTNVERRTIVWLEIALPVAGDDDDDESTITKTGVGKNS